MEKELIDIAAIIQLHKDKVYRKINEELVAMYFEIGKYLSNKIKNLYPNLKGFDKRGIYRMIQFYETYGHNIIVSSLLTQISWANNLIIMPSTKSLEEKEFYLRLCIKYNYSSRELNRQISSGYVERYLLSDETVAEYSVAQNNSNIAISTYETKLINKKLLENKIKEIREILNVDK